MKGKIMVKKMRHLLLFAVVSALVFSGCRFGLPGADPLDGTRWRLVSFDGIPPINGTHPTLAFEDGQVSGNASCNSFGGEYQVRGGKVEFGELFWTLMACPEPSGIMEQEQMYMRILGGEAQFKTADGQLILTDQQGEVLVFERTAPAD